jgi:Ca2+-binding RTX toxin-like protein
VVTFVHATNTAIGTAADLSDGTLGSFLTNVGLVNFGGTATTTFTDIDDVAINFTSPSFTVTTNTSMTEALFEAALQYNITGTAAANTITGGDLADTISGGGGADLIVGGAGADTITVVAAGTDTVTGGQGADTIELTATGAADTVRFALASGTAGTAAAATSLGIDVITNFSGGTDILNFSEAAFGNLNGGAGVASIDQTQVIALANTATVMNGANAQIDGDGAITVTNGAFAVVGTNAAGNTVALYFITSGADVATTIAAGVTAGTVVQIATIGLIDGALALGGFVGIA